MRSFLNYLHQRRRSIAVAAVCAGLFLAAFLLYRLPLTAVAYPTALCAVVLLFAAVWDYRRMMKQHFFLQRMMHLKNLLPQELEPAAGMIEADYQALVQLLCIQRQQMLQDMDLRYRDMVEYYTIWAHQIKTPIAAMRLQLQNQDTEQARQLLLQLLRIEQYVQMALMFFRLDEGACDYVIRTCDLDKLVRLAVKKFSGEFITRHLHLNYAPLQANVVSDEKWLCFVIEQVLSNALKYTQQGNISIFMREPKTLCIRDTGIGIAPDDLPRIFEKGYTGYHGREDKRASGIGLYLCRRICGNLGHKIWAESQPGAGTTVFIDLSQQRLETE